MDYDDLLLTGCGSSTRARGGASYARRFRHVLVDEYQDTNRLQGDIVDCSPRRKAT